MADNKGTHSSNNRTRLEFPEAKGKIVELVEFDIEPDFYGVTIRFQDRTSLTFSMESCVFTFPIFSQWTDEGEENVIKEYEPIRSQVLGVSLE